MNKTLGQIAYEAVKDGGEQSYGPWDTALPTIRKIHEEMALAVKEEVLRRISNHMKESCDFMHNMERMFEENYVKRNFISDKQGEDYSE
jgi:predicted small metal-binding protein